MNVSASNTSRSRVRGRGGRGGAHAATGTFVSEDVLFVVIHHILQMFAQIVVLDAFNVHFYVFVCMF